MEQNKSNQSNNNANTENQQQVSGQPSRVENPDDGQQGAVVKVVIAAAVALIVGFGGGMLASEATELTLLNDDESQQQEDTAGQDGSQDEAGNQLEVPEGAEVISECAEGRGKQFVLPEDIPFGPVYGVWEDEVTSVEYMLGKDDFLDGTDYIDVDLMNEEYDHMNVGLLSDGHSGYPEPHYHVDIFTITHEESEQITCD